MIYTLSVYRLLEMLAEYDRIVKAIPGVLLPLMKPYCDRVDEAIKPGLNSLSWASLNIDACKKDLKTPKHLYNNKISLLLK